MSKPQPSAAASVGVKRGGPGTEGRFAHDVQRPFLIGSALVVVVCIVSAAASLLVSSQNGAYLFLAPGLCALGCMLFFWARMAPLLRESFANEEALAAYLVEERRFAAVESPMPQHGRANALSIAFTDPMTGLGNRMRLAEKFRSVAASTPAGRSFAVGLMNLDGMKPINDLFGNGGGDEIIRQTAARLAAAVEGDGFVCRYVGDEFAFIFPFVDSEGAVAEKGKLLQSVMLAPFDLSGKTVRLSGSFGFALSPFAGETVNAVMDNIETALYHSKRSGRGRVTVYTREVEQMVRENAAIEQALRSAVAHHAVTPHFQPIISLQDGRLLGFEALARWKDPELGFVSPARFIPLAEERGIIGALTESLLFQAARAAVDWPEELFLSFNLSSVQLMDMSTAQMVKDLLARAGLPAHRLELEVTETAMMSDPDTAAAIIDSLHQAGIRISMDDFGTGQSSLGRLRELKLDKVKIDRAFICAIGEDKPAEHIVRAILEMCAGLELMVVAEGIEELHQAESLKLYGCHAGQGYLFGKPQDARHTLAYINQFTALVDHAPDTQRAAAGRR